MITVLEYLIVAAVIGAVVFAIVSLVFGRGEQMAPLSPRTSPAELPDAAIGGADVRAVKFAMAVRGYRMSDVDWVLDRLAARIDDLEAQNAALNGPLSNSDVDIQEPLEVSKACEESAPSETARPSQFSERTQPPDASPVSAGSRAMAASEIRPSIDSDAR